MGPQKSKAMPPANETDTSKMESVRFGNVIAGSFYTKLSLPAEYIFDQDQKTAMRMRNW